MRADVPQPLEAQIRVSAHGVENGRHRRQQAARAVLSAMRRWRAGAPTLVLPDGEPVHIGDPERPPEVTVTERVRQKAQRQLRLGCVSRPVRG